MAVEFIACPHCAARDQQGVFCRSCSRYMPDSTGSVQRVTYNRRFFGDYLLEGVLMLVTLIIGWYIWLFFTAKTAQTPAKRLLGVYILDVNSGQPLRAGQVWVREVLVKQILVGLVNGFTSGLGGAVNALWVFFDKNRQALHDKVVSTAVVYAPLGLPEELPRPTGPLVGRRAGAVKDIAGELRELAKLREEGILSDEEYERKRQELAEQL